MKQKRPILLIRRVHGESMQPSLKPGQIVLASGLFRQLSPQQVVIIRHQGLEKIKRIERLRQGHVFVVGDNPRASRDSHQFGWLPLDTVVARVFWPRLT
jgi:phage repressor protein C with HTH and peptisase S24 domain